MGEEGVVLHRAAVRVALETEAEPTILGPLLTGVTATRVQVPIYLEVAGATARLDRMSCSEDRSKAAAVFSTSTSRSHFRFCGISPFVRSRCRCAAPFK